MASKKPLRLREAKTTVRFDHDVDQRLRVMASQLGYTITDYLSILIRGHKPIARPAAELQNIALAAERIARAIGTLKSSEGDHSATLKALREAGDFIEADLLKATPAYHAAAQAESISNDWGKLEHLAAND